MKRLSIYSAVILLFFLYLTDIKTTELQDEKLFAKKLDSNATTIPESHKKITPRSENKIVNNHQKINIPIETPKKKDLIVDYYDFIELKKCFADDNRYEENDFSISTILDNLTITSRNYFNEINGKIKTEYTDEFGQSYELEGYRETQNKRIVYTKLKTVKKVDFDLNCHPEEGVIICNCVLL